MIPTNSLSVPNVPGTYYNPSGQIPYRDMDWAIGGVALNNPFEGLDVRVWRAWLDKDTGDVWLGSQEDPVIPDVLMFTQPGTTDISLSFDQNMNPTISFLQSGVAKIWWFDTFVGAMAFTSIGPGNGVPKCTLDDRRLSMSGTSDIILGYTRGGSLYFRQQRDRFLIERLLKTGVVGDVIKIGMGQNLRLYFQVGLIE